MGFVAFHSVAIKFFDLSVWHLFEGGAYSGGGAYLKLPSCE